MDCSEVQNLILAYCRDELDEETRRQVEEHLNGCPSCQDYWCREQALGRLVGGSSVDDPPEEYWGGYNDQVRSRIRGAVAISWRLGCLPGCLLGMIGGILAGPLVVWLSFGNGLAAVEPGLRWPLELALLIISAGTIGTAGGLLIRHAIRRGLPKYQIEEVDMRCRIANNRTYRATFVVLLIGIHVGVSVFIALYQYRVAEHQPPWARYTLAVAIFLVYAAIVPGYYRHLNDYLEGRVPSWNCGRWSRKWIWIRVLAPILVLLFVTFPMWEMYVTRAGSAVFDASIRADTAYDSGEVQTAISILRDCIRKYPDQPRVLDCYDDLGDIYAETDRRQEAQLIYLEGIKAYKRLLTHPTFYYAKDDRLDLLEGAGRLYAALGQKQKARELYDTMLKLDPDNLLNMYNVATKLDEIGFEAEARALYAEIILKRPNSLEAEDAREALKDDN